MSLDVVIVWTEYKKEARVKAMQSIRDIDCILKEKEKWLEVLAYILFMMLYGLAKQKTWNWKLNKIILF